MRSKILLGAVIAGLVAGGSVSVVKADDNHGKTAEKNACKGKNGCEGANSCKGANACKGKKKKKAAAHAHSHAEDAAHGSEAPAAEGATKK